MALLGEKGLKKLFSRFLLNCQSKNCSIAVQASQDQKNKIQKLCLYFVYFKLYIIRYPVDTLYLEWSSSVPLKTVVRATPGKSS